MTGLKSRVFQPNPAAHAVYKELYPLYRKLHDAFGTQQADRQSVRRHEAVDRHPQPGAE